MARSRPPVLRDGAGPGELLLERLCPGQRVVVERVHALDHLVLPQDALRVLRQEVGPVHLAGKPVLEHLDGRHQVEPEQGQVGEVVARERLAVQVGVHQAQTAEPALAGAGAAHIRELQLAGVADHHRLHVPLAIEEDADLPVGLERHLGEVPGELRRDDHPGVDAASVGAAEGVELGGLEAEGVSEDVLHSRSVGV